MSLFTGKRVLLGVTGGISAFKSIELLRLLVKSGAQVNVVMTQNATRFVGPATFQGLSSRPVILDLYDLPGDVDNDVGTMPHLALAEEADLALVVPATANTIAKMAHGLADNALTATLLSVTAPIIIAPAMDSDMWRHPATQQNVTLLGERGVHIVGPVEGELARLNRGPGRLAEPVQIFAAAEYVLYREAARSQEGRLGLEGRRILVTAGGTREPIDPVRYIGNRSSGKMGFAIAKEAAGRGASVTLITGPTALQQPGGCDVVGVETAAEMKEAVERKAGEADVVIMAAAVADYRAAHVEASKVKKRQSSWQLSLVRNPDIAAGLGTRKRNDQVLVIFAAETENLLEHAAEKLRAKGADMIVANDVTKEGSGFEVETNEVSILFADGDVRRLPLMSKAAVAGVVVDNVARLLAIGVVGE